MPHFSNRPLHISCCWHQNRIHEGQKWRPLLLHIYYIILCMLEVLHYIKCTDWKFLWWQCFWNWELQISESICVKHKMSALKVFAYQNQLHPHSILYCCRVQIHPNPLLSHQITLYYIFLSFYGGYISDKYYDDDTYYIVIGH